jgi:hypothetical protein
MVDYQKLLNSMQAISSLGNPSLNFTKHDIETVNGYSEAKDFKLNRDERIILLDSNDNIIYIKECDEIGKCTLKVFECTEVTEKYQLQNTPTSFTKEELDKITNDIAELKNIILGKGVKDGKHNAE